MAKEVINIGSIANDGTGDTLREAMRKANLNFDELFAPTVVQAGLRKGMQFDGVDDYVYIQDNDNLDFGTGDFSIEWHGSISQLGSNTPLIDKENGIPIGYGLWLANNNKFHLFVFGATQSVSFETTNAITATGDYHVVATLSRSGNSVIYVNGVASGSVVSTGLTETISNTSDLNIARVSYGGVFHRGNTYLTRLYNRALSASEVLTMWNDGHPELYAVPYADKGGSQTAIYTSDFSAGADSWTGVRGTLAGNIDAIAGVDNILRYYADTDNSSHFLTSTTYTSLLATKKYRVTLDYYLPSGQSAVDGFFVCARSSGYLKKLDGSNYTTINSVTDTWTTITIEVILPDSGIGIRQTSGGAGSFIGAGNVADDLIYIKNLVITQIGNVADYQGEWAGDLAWRDLSGNGLHGITSGSPVLAIPYPETQFVSTGNFVTDIASGTANKDITIPEGYYVDRVSLRNQLSAGNITNFQAILDPAGDNITLLSGKTINNGKNAVIQVVADQTWNTSGRSLRFNATGNGAGGIIIECLIRRKY